MIKQRIAIFFAIALLTVVVVVVLTTSIVRGAAYDLSSCERPASKPGTVQASCTLNRADWFRVAAEGPGPYLLKWTLDCKGGIHRESGEMLLEGRFVLRAFGSHNRPYQDLVKTASDCQLAVSAWNNQGSPVFGTVAWSRNEDQKSAIRSATFILP